MIVGFARRRLALYPSFAACVAFMSLLACGPSPDARSNAPETTEPPIPVVEREEIDGITRVRNVSGSVWQGRAHLEEISTIGSEEVEESFFAMPYAFWVTESMVLVGDRYYSFVRAFDREGRFLRSYGGRGEGPGEFELLLGAGLLEGDRVAVASFRPSKLSIFNVDGSHVADWPVPANDDLRETMRFLVSSDGRPFWETQRLEPNRARQVIGGGHRRGYRELTADGWRGESIPLPWRDVERPAVEYSCPDMQHLGGRCTKTIPWTPGFVSVMTPDLTALSGTTDEYSFEVRRRDGSVIVVEHYQQPTPITPRERRVTSAFIEAEIQRYVPGYDFDEGQIPKHKPAFFSFTRSRDGRLMVAREGRSRWDEERCGPPEAWKYERGSSGCNVTETWIDAFESDGSYIGSFLVPPEAWFGGSFIDGDEIWMQAEDETGNTVVKGYRIVVPEGGA